MNANQNTISSFPTNELIAKGETLNNINQKPKKRVTFKETVILINIESFKEYNKLMCFDETIGLAEYFRSLPYGSNPHTYYDYKSLHDLHLDKHSNPNYRTRKPTNDDCCMIL